MESRATPTGSLRTGSVSQRRAACHASRFMRCAIVTPQALIASGMDPVTVSRRLGHGSPTVTMSVYAHLFGRSDEAAAEAMDAAMGLKEK